MKRLTLENLNNNTTGRFHGVTSTGVNFEVEISNVNRRMTGNELMKFGVTQMSRGLPLNPSAAHVQETRIALFVPNRHRHNIDLLPNNAYRSGVIINRSLQQVVFEVLVKLGVEVRKDIKSTPKVL